jgi:hypothetical protein
MSGPIGDHPNDHVPVVIESSWSMVGLAALGAVVAIWLSVVLFVTQGVTIVSVLVALLAVLLTVVILFDLPLSATFTREGVERRALLRRHRIPWVQVRRLSRLRSGILRTFRAEVRGGLVADVGGRSYLLVDRTESPIEFDELRRVLGDQADRLGLDETLRPGYRNPDASRVWSLRRRRR